MPTDEQLGLAATVRGRSVEVHVAGVLNGEEQVLAGPHGGTGRPEGRTGAVQRCGQLRLVASDDVHHCDLGVARLVQRRGHAQAGQSLAVG